tara:strand:+ start:36208 stop:37002 length:795 start_codon:yes stop_codon:yes gene_type:complete
VRFKITKVERSKLKNIKKRRLEEAVETDSPVDNQMSDLRTKGIEDIEGKFNFIRSLFPILSFVLWILLILIPYLDRISNVYISVIAAVVSVVAGLALRPFLENLFSGVVISFFKSIRVGDTVRIDGHYGIIEEIGLAYSILKRWDWNRIVIPNTKLLQKEIENMTMNDHFIWAHVEFFVAPNSDLSNVEEIAKKVARESQYFLGNEEPAFWVMDLMKDSIRCWIAAWTKTPSEAWELRNQVRTELLKELQKNGISFHQYHISQT